MAAAPRDMTTGELEVRLDSFESNVMAILQDIRANMVTKDVSEAHQASNERRMKNTEDALEKWIKTSTETHVQLDAESKARHAETIALVDRVVASLEVKVDKVNARVDDANEKTSLRIKELKERRESDEKDLKSARNSRWNIALVAVLAVVGNVITFFATSIRPGG